MSDVARELMREALQVIGEAFCLVRERPRLNGEALSLDLINHPELLEKPQHACMSAAWFWSSRGLNTLADAGSFSKITSRINGGQNGAAGRQVLYAKALKVLA